MNNSMSSIFGDDADFKKHVQKSQSDSAEIEDFIKEKQAFIENADSEETTRITIEHHDHDPEDTFELAQPQAQASKQILQEPVKKQTHRGKRLTKLTWREKANDWFRTSLYFIIFFILGYLAFNYQAYSEVAVNLYYDFTGQERDSVLRTFTANQPVSELAGATETPGSSSTIPTFDMEIIPPGTRVILPRLGKNVPVVPVGEDNLVNRDWEGLEQDLQSALRDGVVHYPGTPWPGQSGNVVLTGHSSYYPWDSGRFKDVFAVLHSLSVGDEVVVFHNQRKYNYQVTDRADVRPDQVNVLGDTGDDRLTLLTCTPIGTNLRRLIITAKPIGS